MKQEMHEDFFDDDRTDDSQEDEDEWGCVFGDNCCMPGDHKKNECHTAEMIEDYAKEQSQISRNRFK